MSEESYKKIFSLNLRKYMELNNKTQIDLINDLGFNKSAVSTWCNGTRLPRMDKVEALANYFGIKSGDLIEEHNESDQPSCYLDEFSIETADFLHKNPEYKELFEVAKNIGKEDIDLVVKILDKFRK